MQPVATKGIAQVASTRNTKVHDSVEHLMQELVCTWNFVSSLVSSGNISSCPGVHGKQLKNQDNALKFAHVILEIKPFGALNTTFVSRS